MRPDHSSPLRVGISAGLFDETGGGVVQFTMGLAYGLSKLQGGNEEYIFLTTRGSDQWIRPYLQGPCRVLEGPPVPRLRWLKGKLAAVFPRLRRAGQALRSTLAPDRIRIPTSDGTIERASIEVMHFPFPSAFLTDVPSIYHPWDLQHLHLPEFFSTWERGFRERTYRAFCEQAKLVSVASSWVKRDLIQQYGLPEEKIKVVPAAPAVDLYPRPTAADLESVRRKFSLPEAFAFYPARTWAHKNHLGLMEAANILRDRYGLSILFVFSGAPTEFYARIRRQIRRLRLDDQVKFLGFVSPLEMRCLYKLCRCMIFPTRFEGFGLPVTEALLTGAPTACSNVNCLPDLVGDSALIFNPDDPRDIAEAIRRLWTDEALRRTLVERGHRTVARFSWQRTARTFRAHYRRLAARPLTEEDRELIQEASFTYESAPSPVARSAGEGN